MRHCRSGMPGSSPGLWCSVYCCDDIATESEEGMNIDIATITCPMCGADADSLCFYPGEAFCMNCGEVFDLTENARDSRELIKNSIN